jgi:hypothetical protein
MEVICNSMVFHLHLSPKRADVEMRCFDRLFTA